MAAGTTQQRDTQDEHGERDEMMDLSDGGEASLSGHTDIHSLDGDGSTGK